MTAGGLVFIGATNFDRKFRAFDKDTGELLWETTMINSGNATPATYQVAGTQYMWSFRHLAATEGPRPPVVAGGPPTSAERSQGGGGRGRGAGPSTDVGTGGPSGGAFCRVRGPLRIDMIVSSA